MHRIPALSSAVCILIGFLLLNNTCVVWTVTDKVFHCLIHKDCLSTY